MAAYSIANYRITNPEAYRGYPPAVFPTVAAHGAEVLVADYSIVIRFPSKAAARAWYACSEYRRIDGLRTDNSEGMVTLADEVRHAEMI